MEPKVPCAGAIVFDAQRRLLLIQRGQAPSAGTWSVPGGRCEPGETPEQACVREVREETGAHVQVVRWAGRVERPAPDGRVFVIDDYVCELARRAAHAASLQAGDDAADVRWVGRAELDTLPLAPGLHDALAEWGLLPS